MVAIRIWHCGAFPGSLAGDQRGLRVHGRSCRIAGGSQEPRRRHQSIRATRFYFDSPGKLASWRGALFRNLVRVLEAYARASVVPTGMVGAVPLGVSHFTVSGTVTPGWVMTQWHQMFLAGSFTVLHMHSVDVQPVGKLDWLLDSISTEVRAGRLRLVATSEGLLDGVSR
jgi:hypothetical protein